MRRWKRSKSTELVPIENVGGDAAEALGALDGGVRTQIPSDVVSNGRKRYAPKVGFAPGEKPLISEGGDRPKSAGMKIEDDFLFPPMLGAFVPSYIRKLPVEELRARYLKVLNATMGNHSMALFYCDWTQEQFEEVLNARFKKQITSARAQLADRVTYIMHRAMGLIKSGKGSADTTANTQIITAMAKVAEKLNDHTEMQETKKGYKLVIEGLQEAHGAPAERAPEAPK